MCSVGVYQSTTSLVFLNIFFSPKYFLRNNNETVILYNFNYNFNELHIFKDFIF